MIEACQNPSTNHTHPLDQQFNELNALVKCAPALNEQHHAWQGLSASKGLLEVTYATDGMWMARTQTDAELKTHLKPTSLKCRFFFLIKTNSRIDL